MAEVTNDISEVQRIYTLQHQEENVQRIKNTTYSERIAKIRKIEKFILDKANQERLFKAMWYDLNKPKEEVIATEIALVLSAIRHIYKNLPNWISPLPVGAPLSLFGIQSKIVYEPKGHVLIMSPWNYPFQLVLLPLVHAIAAGNVILIKPSEASVANSKFMEEMISLLFDENEVAVIQGDIPVSTAILEKKFHHIFFTGSPSIGKIVMAAAAKHLTSVTLELGGKSQ